MTARSLRVSKEKISFVKQALTSKKLSQTQLIARLECSRQPVSKFLNGKPVECEIFFRICEILGLNVQDITCQDIDEAEDIDIYSLVQEVRQKIKPLIQERCGTMRVLDMTQAIGLNDIYTSVNILEKITGRRRKEIAELLKERKFEDLELMENLNIFWSPGRSPRDCLNIDGGLDLCLNSENFDRFGLGNITETRVPGMDAVEKYTKLIILGKPGSGKTTFLKYIAIQCLGSEFQAERVPIFITIKDFAEAANKPSLSEYIHQQFINCGTTIDMVAELFKHNKGLVLLDGLDEVKEEDSHRVLKEITDFCDLNRENKFIITSRIAAQEYTFEKFTEVEVADFDSKQITTFAKNWFKDKAVKPENFLKHLQENNRIYELATNPLLLTLLCLVFEESGNFPANRSELYKEGLDALLKKWDAKRGIYRAQIYKKVSVQRKEDLLSKIAMTTFERSDYFFKQKVAEQYIMEYIRNLPDASTDPEVLQLDSEAVLKSIEAQHGLLVERAKGIYSFSHLTFHEYFTAREFVVVKQSLEEALLNLVSHITDYRWREVFLLAVGMSPNANRLLVLMKQQVDAIVANDEKLQQFLMWLNQKSICLKGYYNQLTIRAFYLTRDSERQDCYNYNYYFDSISSFNYTIDLDRALELALDYYLDLNLAHALDHALEHSVNFDINLIYALDLASELAPEMERELQHLNDQLPEPRGNKEISQQWWETNGKSWAEQLRAIIIKYRNIGHDWQFNEPQKELLKQYYNTNKLLIDCLNSDCYVSREVRQYIEDTLLLPISEIEKYPKPNL